MSIELKPCPFCGSEQLAYYMDQGDKWGRVICDCGAQGPDVRTGYREHDDPEKGWAQNAADEWNKREVAK